MKNLLSILLLFPCFQLTAQNTKFIAVMEKNIAIMDTAKSAISMLNLANQFERIGNAEPTEWLPLYYRAWLHIMISYQETDLIKKDALLDMSLELISRADSMMPDHSEIYALKSLALSSKIGIEPAIRGQKFGPISGMALEKAIKLDPGNPRPYLLKGQNALYTPAQYGGGKDKALPLLEQAVEKFKTYKPSNSIMPKWGEKRAQDALNQCKNID